MSEKEYDPQYETKVPHFNKDIACEWVINKENDKIKHWLENGRPHKRIVTEALYCCGYNSNLEALKLIYESDWLKKVNVLKIALDAYSECCAEERDEQYKWIVDKIFNEKDKSVKAKRKYFIYEMYKTYIGKDIAIKHGVDFKIKEAVEDLNDLLDTANSGHHQYKLHKSESNLKRAEEALKKSINYIKNGTPLKVHKLVELMKYSEEKSVITFLNNIISLEKIYFTDDVMPSLFLTELPMWKRFNHINDDKMKSIIKLFKNSGVKENIIITSDDLNNNRVLNNYLDTRRYKIGSVEIVGVELNNRTTEIKIEKNQQGMINPLLIKIDIREYVFIEQTGDNRNISVSDKEKKDSKEKYDLL